MNVACWCSINPDEGLAGTNTCLLDRFARVEPSLGSDLQGDSIGELENYWHAAKAQIRTEGGKSPVLSEASREDDPKGRDVAQSDFQRHR